MGYLLVGVNKDAGDFKIGAYSFPVLLELTNYLFPCIHHGGKWYCNFAADDRMVDEDVTDKEKLYPKILSSGFKVTAKEASIMARMAKNWVGIQRSLPESHRNLNSGSDTGVFTRENLLDALSSIMSNTTLEPEWPRKIRDDFVNKIEKFAEWAPNSGGFSIR